MFLLPFCFTKTILQILSTCCHGFNALELATCTSRGPRRSAAREFSSWTAASLRPRTVSEDVRESLIATGGCHFELPGHGGGRVLINSSKCFGRIAYLHGKRTRVSYPRLVVLTFS